MSRYLLAAACVDGQSILPLPADYEWDGSLELCHQYLLIPASISKSGPQKREEEKKKKKEEEKAQRFLPLILLVSLQIPFKCSTV